MNTNLWWLVIIFYSSQNMKYTFTSKKMLKLKNQGKCTAMFDIAFDSDNHIECIFSK